MKQEELRNKLTAIQSTNNDYQFEETIKLINRHVKEVIGNGLPKNLGIARVTINGKDYLIEEGTKEVEIINGLIAEQKERAGL